MIVIPMAGLSSRFTRMGYTEPKYMLPLWGGTVFDHSVASFRADFETEKFLFVARQYPGIKNFLESRLEVLGLKHWSLVILEEDTQGQAETVALGLERMDVSGNEAVTVFNIDTFCRAGFQPNHKRWSRASGVLQVFQGSGDNWSFVEPIEKNSNRVRRTAEKQPISDLCCTGLYHFSKADDYRRAFEKEKEVRQAAELYVAPIYNHLIAEGQAVYYDLIAQDEVTFCGVPAEYEALLLGQNPDE